MEIEIRELKKKDHKEAIKWAIQGMHLNRYLDEGILLNLYGRYFWDLELLKATQIISAYYNDEFVGILLARMKDERTVYKSFWKSLYVKVFDILQKAFAGKGVDIYDTTNKELLKEYNDKVNTDGEIVFLAAKPNSQIKGIGTKLLEEFEKREKGKQVYLYTDDACTYQFYDHRDFNRVGEKSIEMEIRGKKVPITCMLYGKKIETSKSPFNCNKKAENNFNQQTRVNNGIPQEMQNINKDETER